MKPRVYRSVRGLDETDRKILTILQDDARTPFSRIAKMLNFSETAVRYRVRRLLRMGVIDRFTVILNPRVAGYPVSAIVLLRVDHKLLREVFEALAALPSTSHIIQTTGEYDLVVVVHATSSGHLSELTTRIRGMQGVREASVWMTTGLYKLDFRLKLL